MPQIRSSPWCSRSEEGFYGVLCRTVGRVHRDTAPIIRCNCWRVSTKTCVKSSVRTIKAFRTGSWQHLCADPVFFVCRNLTARGRRRWRRASAERRQGARRRGPKTLLSRTRPAPPSEVASPLGPAVTVGYVAATAPLLAVSSLRGADGVDDTAVKFLFCAELKKKKEEERKVQERFEREQRRQQAFWDDFEEMEQSVPQFSQALNTFHIFYVFLDSDPEVVPESGHSSAHRGTWQPLVQCLPCPRCTEKLDVLRDDFSQCFLRAPGIWQSLVQCPFSACLARGFQEN